MLYPAALLMAARGLVPRRETAMSPELAGVAEFTDGTTPLGGIVDIEETRTRVFGRL